MSIQQVYSKGIYHGLPTFPDDVQDLTAVVTGANGISGYYMLKVLAQAPKRWKKIYCLSRRPPLVEGGLPSNAEHIACDFLEEPEKIAKVLKEKNVAADYIFFFSYIQPPPKEGKGLWSDHEEMVRVNTNLLANFLSALPLANIKPRRFMLQTGAKHYGLHLGLIKQPMQEWDPLVNIEPNFYYYQEEKLSTYCSSNSVGYDIVMPSSIVGAVPDAAMNIAFPLAVYCVVNAHLKRPLEYPGSISSWQMPQCMSSSMLNAYLEEWAVLAPKANNQRFNAVDNSEFTWEAVWPMLAGWYGLEWKGPVEDPTVYKERQLPHNPRGYGPKGTVQVRQRMADWAKRDDVKAAWTEISKQHGLRGDGELHDVDRVFDFADGSLNRPAPILLTTDKARKLGWHGYVDSAESLLETFEDFAKIKMIPPVPKEKVQFL